MLDSCIKKNILVSQYDVDNNKYFRNKMTVLDWICLLIQTLMDVKKIFQSYILLNINVLHMNHRDHHRHHIHFRALFSSTEGWAKREKSY